MSDKLYCVSGHASMQAELVSIASDLGHDYFVERCASGPDINVFVDAADDLTLEEFERAVREHTDKRGPVWLAFEEWSPEWTL